MQDLTLSTLLQSHLEPFLASHRLPIDKIKTLKCYRACRSAALGGHSQYCENGHLMGVWYDSCKRRGCPQCQSLPTERWLNAQKEVLLDTTHHHWIFTLPHQLLPLWRFNRELLQDVLFSAVAKTLKQLAGNKPYLDAQPAFLLTLHTWGRNLSLHPHIHCLIAHGGLSQSGQWRAPKKKCLFPAKVMMQLFRGKFLADLKNRNDIALPPDMRANQLRALINKLGRLDWVVHCCKPYQHGKGVVTYLAHYVKGGAFNNRQLRYSDHQNVSLCYMSHRTKKRSLRRFTIPEFLQSLCSHIPPKGKPALRYYGLYHSCRRVALNHSRQELGQGIIKRQEPITWQQYITGLARRPLCAICNAPLAVSRPCKEKLLAG